LATCIVSVFFPALGPYELLGLTAADHPNIGLITGTRMTEPILWMRTALFTDPVPSFGVGLISFPSFHTATAAIYTWVVWRTPIIRRISLALNALMLIATPIHGSHYLVDLFAGFAVAAASIAVTAWMFGRVGQRRQPALSTAESAAWLNVPIVRCKRGAPPNKRDIARAVLMKDLRPETKRTFGRLIDIAEFGARSARSAACNPSNFPIAAGIMYVPRRFCATQAKKAVRTST
jgi:membrane-associated phospholipid phosphatase